MRLVGRLDRQCQTGPLMHLSHVVALPLLLTASCAGIRPVMLAAEPQPRVVTTQPALRQQTPATPAPPTPQPPTTQGKPGVPVPDEKARAPRPAEKAAPPVAAAPAVTAPVTAPLDLKALEQRLRNTKAIGILTKITLKNQVDDLLADPKTFATLRA